MTKAAWLYLLYVVFGLCLLGASVVTLFELAGLARLVWTLLGVF